MSSADIVTALDPWENPKCCLMNKIDFVVEQCCDSIVPSNGFASHKGSRINAADS